MVAYTVYLWLFSLAYLSVSFSAIHNCYIFEYGTSTYDLIYVVPCDTYNFCIKYHLYLNRWYQWPLLTGPVSTLILVRTPGLLFSRQIPSSIYLSNLSIHMSFLLLFFLAGEQFFERCVSFIHSPPYQQKQSKKDAKQMVLWAAMFSFLCIYKIERAFPWKSWWSSEIPLGQRPLRTLSP